MYQAIIGIPAHPNMPKEVIQHCVGDNYVDSVMAVGGLPLLFPVKNDPEAIEDYLSMVDGVLIPGGIDVNPLTYGEAPIPQLGDTDITYDEFQTAFIKRAMELKKPMIGICRGIQIINVVCGGTLYQDLCSQRGNGSCLHTQKERRSYQVSHMVTTEENSLARDLFGERIGVNSFHHQAIKDLGKGLRITGRACDGIPEVIEGTGDTFLFAVQWHPECFINPAARENPFLPIFARLVEEAAKAKSAR